MPELRTVSVDLGARSYQIRIQTSLFDSLAEQLADGLSRCPVATNSKHPNSIFLITDSNVGPLYAERISAAFERLDSVNKIQCFHVPAGEATKSVQQLEILWNQLLASGADRSSHIVALGGGVVGDLAGFAAASFGRGVRFIQIPTSLLSQVDSSVGGKVGINLPGGKNMVGAFWQPVSVLIDPDSLKTLAPREFRSGLAEVVKYGVIMDASFFEFLESNVEKIKELDPEVISYVIQQCCQLKADVVQADETEQSGRRAILNYGHTFGHAIENVFGYGTYTHGEAISIGMHCAAKVSLELGRVPAGMVDRQARLLQQFELPLQLDRPSESRIQQLVEAMRSDKKVTAGKLNLILADEIGSVSLVPAPSEEVLERSFT